jgi:FkbM family methyltransferase
MGKLFRERLIAAWELRNLGCLAAIVYIAQKLRLRMGIVNAASFTLRSKHSLHPLSCRRDSTDLLVFDQIFRKREYRCLDEIDSADLIVDCGANVGYASAYFLSRFPKATVIAVEPEPGNYCALRVNVKPYGDRCRTICSAIWPHKTGLVLSEAQFRRGGDWAFQVRPAEVGEKPSMVGLDIGTILDESGFDRISILKVDIEGAESAVFGSNYEHWIGRIENIVIELHKEVGDAAFLNAISSENFVVSKCDELTVCRRRSPGP